MKIGHHIWAVGLVGILLAGCDQRQTESTANGGSPLVVAMETSYTPPNSKPILAPEGVVFLKTHFAHSHDTGVLGLVPGTVVNIVEKKPRGVLVVDYKGRKFEVEGHQVTNDVGEAEWLFQMEQARQRQLSQSQAAQKQALANRETERRIAFQRALNEAATRGGSQDVPSASIAGVAPSASYESRLNRGPYNPTPGSPLHIHNEIDGKRYWVDHNGERHYIYGGGDPMGASESEGSTETGAPTEFKFTLPPELKALLQQ